MAHRSTNPNFALQQRPAIAFAAIALLMTLAVYPLQLFAQSGPACHTSNMQDAVSPEKLPPPLKLTGIGNVHLKITATPEAQMWFDQGLNLFHDFWDYESVRAFEQGVRVDPACAMCYWGIYQAENFRHSNFREFAKAALAKAVNLKSRASKSERLYIEASAAANAARDADKKDADALEQKEIKTYRKLVKQFPHDMQARIFLAQALSDGYDDDGKPRPGQKEALEILQSVLKDEAENSAANHYWIHAVEASPHPEQALHSAEILGRLAPASGHMVHMPGHIFYRTGDYVSAQTAFNASTQADERYMQEQKVQVDDDWNYVHNLMYSIANLMEAGKLAEATALSAKLKEARGQLENTLYIWSARDGISRLDPRLPVALRAADWPTALSYLKNANPPDSLPNLQFLSRALTAFVTGMQALNDLSATQVHASSAQLDAELWRLSERLKAEDDAKSKEKGEGKKSAGAMPRLMVMPDASAKPLLNNLSIMSLELRAGLLVADKKFDEAKKLYAQAAQKEKDLGYREPPAYIRPVQETEAAAFLAASNWTEAKAAFHQALSDRPHSGFPLYGIALASEQSGDSTAAATEYQEFLSSWKGADSDLPQLAHARAYVAAHGASAAAR